MVTPDFLLLNNFCEFKTRNTNSKVDFVLKTSFKQSNKRFLVYKINLSQIINKCYFFAICKLFT